MAPRLRVVRTVPALRAAVGQWRKRGERIALVPTMGALHAGHLALVRAARRRARRLVVSIFVNPAQFAPHEDFASYPRTFDTDLAALSELAVDLIWAPPVAVMYPPGFATRIVPEGPAAVGLEDKFRPHFFGGVTTVVGKLLIQCAPDFAMFGEKDYQQLKVVTRLAKDLDLPLKIVGVPTVRERDGLALSSRNAYLSATERAAAPALHRVLTDCADRIARIAREDGRERPYGAREDGRERPYGAREDGRERPYGAREDGRERPYGAREDGRERPYGELLARVLDEGGAAIERAGFTLDYLEARNADTLEPVTSAKAGPLRLLVAARIGKTRLIDNVAVGSE
jgi:pantoate--beta-alanine ligase